MEYLNEWQKQKTDTLIEKFKEGEFSCWFDNLSDHNKRNLALLLNNQMQYVNRLTDVQMGHARPWDILDLTCQEFKKLITAYPENVFVLPTAIAEFQYYNKAGEKRALQVRSSFQRKEDKVELVDTLQNYFEKNFCLKFKKEDFKIFPLLLWVLPANIDKEDPCAKPQDCWYGDMMIVPEGEPPKEETKDEVLG